MKWREVMISDVCSSYSGGTPPTQMKELYYGGKIPWVKSGELNDDILLSTDETLSDEGFKNSSAKWAPTGSILVAMYGATVGKTAMLGIPATTNQAVCCIVPNSLIADNKYIWYAIRSKVSYLLSQRVGGAQPNINQTIIQQTLIPLPPLSEQRRIVDILEQVDTLRRKRAEADKNIRRLLPALFYKMFGDPQEMAASNLGVPLSSLNIDIQNGFACGEKDVVDGIPHLRMNNIDDDGTLNLDVVRTVPLDKDLNKYRLQKSDVLFMGTNSEEKVGKSCLFLPPDNRSYLFSNHLIRLRVSDAFVTPEYLSCFLHLLWKQRYFQSVAKRWVNQASIDQSTLLAVRIHRQSKTVLSSFTHRYQEILDLKKRQAESENRISRVFSTLLHHAFSGELTAKWRQAHMKELLQEMEAQTRELGFPVPDAEDSPIRVTDFLHPLLEKKAILLGYIILHSLGAKHPMARVKLAKQYYFANQFMQQPLTEHFKPMAAGPLDNDIFAALELAQVRKWIVIEPQKGKEKPLTAGVNIAETKDLVVDILGSAKKQVDEFLDSTKDWGWQTLERWATVHSVAQKLINDKHPLTVESIKSRIQTIPEWGAKLKRCEFSEANINKALMGLRHWSLITE